MWITAKYLKEEEISEFSINPVCKECFDTNDAKFLEKSKAYLNPETFGFKQCSRCKKWIGSEHFLDNPENISELFLVCEDCLDKTDSKKLGLKKCSKCGKWRLKNKFEEDLDAKDKLFHACEECTHSDIKLRNELFKRRYPFFWIKLIIGAAGLYTILKFFTSLFDRIDSYMKGYGFLLVFIIPALISIIIKGKLLLAQFLDDLKYRRK